MQYTKILKALADDVRLKIFEMLRQGSLCACKIQQQFDITQPTLSHHMKVLCDSGLVLADKQGKWVYYSLNCDVLRQLTAFLSDTACNRKDAQCVKCSCDGKDSL